MSKKILAGFVIVLIAVVIVALSGWWKSSLLPVAPGNTDQVAVVIAKAQAAGVTLEDLHSKGLIRSVPMAKIYLKLSGMEQKIQNGTFIVSPGQDLPSLITTLTLPPKDVWVTIPEGWRREQIALRFDAQLTGINKNFVATDFLAQTRNLEGQLFPDTYLVPATSTAADVIKIMTANFAAKSGLQLPAQQNVLILASLVEREGKTPTDRPIIAGVLTNRLEADWPLQVDAAVQYGRDTVICSKAPTTCDWWSPLADTKFASPYNTYMNSGLPPAAIANPGLSAIQAAANPTATDYWYYIHADDGQAYFGKTLQEHNANIDKYLRN